MANFSYGQLTKLTLEEVIALAKEKSLNAQIAVNKKDNKYWEYRNYLATTLPNLSLSGNLPNYKSGISPVNQDDGSTAFRKNSQASSDLRVSLSQNIPWTGTKISLNSELSRIDILEGKDTGVSYSTTPLYVTVEQPVFAFNKFKWDRKIAPLLYEESKKEFQEEFENISYRATQNFFQLLLAQVDVAIAQKNQANNDTIYNIGKGRYNLGKIAENELLQLQLNTLSSSRDVSTAKIALESARLNLNTFIGRPKGEDFQLISPDQLPIFKIDPQLALEEAKKNRKQYLAFKRRRIEAKREVARAKGNSSLNVNVIGSYGVSQYADDIHLAYKDFNEQQRLRIGFNIPLVDWKQRKSKLLMAEASQKLTENTITQESQLFEQEIIVLAQKIPIIYDRVKSTELANKIAQKQYEISRQRYMVANISITDLNLSLKGKDSASSSYLRALREFWTSYYQLRMLTMYDFENQHPIINVPEEEKP
ncbi:TolC family protein [Halosquirtibacter xylanolyticus]|uniref:TolC family protein n=1 Tax=Halosquirtibacter xylanolyticus TaxID=3374599 RepID=UPI003748141D|nr:TolC family protein [Prolixibacteraceae bacterium]